MHELGDSAAKGERGGGDGAAVRAAGLGRRPPDPGRARALAEAVLEHVLNHGREGLSLRSVAEALSVSTFSLTAHFGSRHGMIDAVIDILIERQYARVQSAMTAAGDQGAGASLRAVWQTCVENIHEDRLLIDVCTDRNGGAAVRRRLVDPWVQGTIAQLVARGWPPVVAETEATLVTACFSGLELDLITTGDLPRVCRAAELMAATFDARWAAPPD